MEKKCNENSQVLSGYIFYCRTLSVCKYCTSVSRQSSNSSSSSAQLHAYFTAVYSLINNQRYGPNKSLGMAPLLFFPSHALLCYDVVAYIFVCLTHRGKGLADILTLRNIQLQKCHDVAFCEYFLV